ncbi:MAG TPA: hypothetical protein VEA69_02510 [Tepidisphaeraceae bacterium]|nr:hypothetical protein [Tepidisphaeraceae bacterium]
MNSRALIATLLAIASLPCRAADAPPDKYLPLVRAHLDKVLTAGVDAVGPDHTAMWLAGIDVRKGGQPAAPKPLRPRWYRDINSPRGSNLYWDQSTLVAALEISRLTADTKYKAAVDRYLADFFAQCVSKETGLFYWGNHAYYDVFADKPVQFEGGYHEIRPHTPAWDVLWAADPAKTERAIRAIAAGHVKDPKTGLFCRHAAPDGKKTGAAKPFLEAGGPIVQSLCWLASKKPGGDADLVDLAVRVAKYSFDRRGETTGLLRNQPVDKRWDYFAATTESGVWAVALLRAADLSGRAELRDMARAAVAAYLKYGWDDAAGLYFGQLDIDAGQPKTPPAKREYMPARYALLFDSFTFPTHNYPMSMAEACVTLYAQTRDDQFRLAITHWVTHVRTSLKQADEQKTVGYAEEYGRTIRFLTRAARALNDPAPLELARDVAARAVRDLHVPDAAMFRTHPGEDRADAVDGVGLLFLALIELDTGKELDLRGMSF